MSLRLAQTDASDLLAAFAQGPAPSADWARANPERALAFLMVVPQPCDALDALLGLEVAADLPVAA